MKKGKVVLVGTGFVGMSMAYTMLNSCLLYTSKYIILLAVNYNNLNCWHNLKYKIHWQIFNLVV